MDKKSAVHGDERGNADTRGDGTPQGGTLTGPSKDDPPEGAVDAVKPEGDDSPVLRRLRGILPPKASIEQHRDHLVEKYDC